MPQVSTGKPERMKPALHENKHCEPEGALGPQSPDLKPLAGIGKAAQVIGIGCG